MAGKKESIDVSKLIDDRKITTTQVVTIALCGLVTWLDGIDTQSIGIAAPLIAKSIGLAPGQFGSVFSSALFGALVGAIGFGPVADRYGRKFLLALSTALFGLFTLLTAYAWNLETLLVVRFLAGVGLGGATPCFISMTSEYAPKRHRAALVALMWSCFALGGMSGGFLNGWIISNFGWREIFHVGGFVPLVVSALVVAFMPESLRFLIGRGADPSKVRAILARMYGSADEFKDATFSGPAPEPKGARVMQLFTEKRGPMTLLLWTPFFLGFGTLAISSLWTPTLLNMAGVTPATAANLIGIYGIGAFLGNASAGKLLDRFGIAFAPVPAFILGAGAFYAFGQSSGSIALSGIWLFLTGALLGMGISSSIVIVSQVYPTSIRSTGAGWAMGMARLGQVILPWVMGTLLLRKVEASVILTYVAFAPVVAAIALLFLSRVLKGSDVGPTARSQTVREGTAHA